MSESAQLAAKPEGRRRARYNPDVGDAWVAGLSSARADGLKPAYTSIGRECGGGDGAMVRYSSGNGAGTIPAWLTACVATAAIGAAAPSLGQGVPARIQQLDGSVLEVDGLRFGPGWKVSGKRKDGSTFDASAAEIVSIGLAKRNPPARPMGLAALMNDGSAIGAGNVALKGEAVILRSDALGEVSIPMSAVRALLLDPDANSEQFSRLTAAMADRTAKADRVLYRNGDVAVGTLSELTEQSVTIEPVGGGAANAVGREFVLGVALDPSLSIPIPRPAVFADARLVDGSAFAVKSIEGHEDSFTLTTCFGATMRVLAADLYELTIRGGKTAYLSELEPVESSGENYFGQPIPALAKDRSADGGRLALGDRTYSKGIGMRSQSRAVYAVEGFSHFEAIVGVNRRAGELANLRFLVKVDGKAAFDSGEMAPGSPPKPVRIELKGAKLLELAVEFARNADADDLADWAEARLIR